MNKNPQKQRMNIQLNQIRSILNDFRKTKYKCVEIAKTINTQMPKQEHFKNVQKTTLRKMDLLDITGLVNLKNQLVRALTDLFEIQRELRYKKQKFDARKQIMETQKQQIQYVRRNYVQSAIQSPRNNKPIFQTNVRSIVSEPKKLQPQIQASKPKNKNLQIPLYRAKNETNENKLDRISKYIASLKRNMKLNSQTLGYKWKIKQFLMQDPNYMKLRTQVQKYMMRQQQLDYLLARAVQKGVKQQISKSQIIESNSQYKLIKVYKKPAPKKIQSENLNKSLTTNKQSKQTSLLMSQNNSQTFNKLGTSITNNNSLQQRHQDLSFNSPNKQNTQYIISDSNNFIFNSPLKKLTQKIQIQSKAQQDFNSIKKQLQKSTQSYIQMLSKINQTVEKGSQKLIQLRQKRKKKFQKDDDIWDQLDKI